MKNSAIKFSGFLGFSIKPEARVDLTVHWGFFSRKGKKLESVFYLRKSKLLFMQDNWLANALLV
jgi:hypothetical protein